MSSAWLAGDAGFLPALLIRAERIEELFPQLSRLARTEGSRSSPCLTANDATLLIFRWRNLVETLSGKQPEQSIAEHSQLISVLLKWLVLFGERRIEPQLANDRIGLVRNYAHRLPALTECLGQARAVGSSVAARQACSPVARVRLMFLIARVEAMLEQAAQAHDGGRATALVRAAIRELAHIVRTSMLLSDGVSVSPEQFYTVASRAIERVVDWLDLCHRQLLAATPPDAVTGRDAVAA